MSTQIPSYAGAKKRRETRATKGRETYGVDGTTRLYGDGVAASMPVLRKRKVGYRSLWVPVLFWRVMMEKDAQPGGTETTSVGGA